MRICVDYGRSTTKAVAQGKETKPIIFPSWYASKVVDPDILPEDTVEFDPIKNLKVDINGNKFNVGQLASRSPYCFDGSSDADIMPDNFDKGKLTKAEINILTAIALLAEEDKQKVELLTTLPANQFNDQNKEMFKDRLKDNFAIKVYDYENQQYKRKEIFIETVQIKKQGFCAFMHHLLNDNGYIRQDREHLMKKSICVLDVGKYSTDVTIIDSMTELGLNSNDVRIKGMADVFTDIRQGFKAKHRFSLHKNKVEEYIKAGEVTINGNKEDITDIINASYSDFAEQVKENLIIKSPLDIQAIEVFIACGGGASPMKENLGSQFNRTFDIINNARMANCLGGLKMMKLAAQMEGE